MKNLDGHVALMLSIEGAVHGRHAARPQVPADLGAVGEGSRESRENVAVHRHQLRSAGRRRRIDVARESRVPRSIHTMAEDIERLWTVTTKCPRRLLLDVRVRGPRLVLLRALSRLGAGFSW